jgi:Protein of unknown function (DUF2938)
MNNLALSLINVIFIGLGATLIGDLWALILKRAAKIASPNYCLVGRWLRYMTGGTFTHSNIASAPHRSAECTIGWIAHYMIGITFAGAFVAVAGNSWLKHPTPIPAIVFGVVTVMAPFFIMQPSFGLGFAASKTSNPTQARLRSLMNHTAFGAGLYLSAWLVNWLQRVFIY